MLRDPFPAAAHGAVLLTSPTSYVWIINRIQTNGEADYAAVHKIQEGQPENIAGGALPST